MSEHDTKSKDWAQDQGLSYKEELKKRVTNAGKKAGTDGAIKIGYIPDNNEHDDVKISIAEEKKKDEELERIVAKQILDEFLADMRERIAFLDKQFKATIDVKKLHEKGKLDFDDPMHIQLIQQAGMNVEDVKNNATDAIEENLNRINTEWNEIKNNIEQKLGDDYSEHPISDEFEKLENVILAHDEDPNAYREADIRDGFTSKEETALSEEFLHLREEDNLDAFFDDGSVSYASTLEPENSIQAKSPREEFMKAANPDKDNMPEVVADITSDNVQVLEKPLSIVTPN